MLSHKAEASLGDGVLIFGSRSNRTAATKDAAITSVEAHRPRFWRSFASHIIRGMGEHAAKSISTAQALRIVALTVKIHISQEWENEVA
jgi:hypothetical protein